jgi:hypothetical protein
MVKWLAILPNLARPCLVTATVLLCAISAGRAQGNITIPQFPADVPLPPRVHKEPKLPQIIDSYPVKPSLQPAFTISVGPLGFSAPGSFYLFRRQSMVSLDFLDENRLLFSFHVQRLMQRDDAGGAADVKARQIRALVVTLPDGKIESKIESEALWTVPDRSRYLWMLKDGHFLLRDSDGLEQGDAKLKVTPFLRLPGCLLWLAMDPTEQVMITNSLEPPDAAQNPGEAASPPASQASMTADRQSPGVQPTLVVRTLDRESGKLIRMIRVPWTNQTTDWPVNSEGYLESAKGRGRQWLLNLNYFAGGSKIVATVDSSCSPTAEFVSEEELFVTTCDPNGGKMVAFSAGGTQLWEARASSNVMWPLVVMAPDGSRLARETLVLKRTANRYRHKRLVGAGDLMGQMVRVFDAADGKVVLEAPLSPMLDGGGNVAISPSGRRVAILNAGAIQIFELAAPARFPAADRNDTSHSGH